MKQNHFQMIAICIWLLFSFCSKNTQTAEANPGEREAVAEAVPPASSYTISMGGNAYVTTLASGSSETVTSTSLANWTNANSKFSAYFRLGLTGSLTVKMRARVLPSGTSVVRVTVNGTPFTVQLSGTAATVYNVGTVNINAAGYVKVDLQGISKTGSYFADVDDLIISGTATASNVVYANDAANYYWSRRGPSVHMSYGSPANTEWMYNEITVPAGEDKIGSYFMANGFSGGYFGIQVNSATERRVLFSVWDPGTGKTTLVRKGPNVVDNTFGGEGTGGQSYLVFNWVAGNTYKFLTQGKPDGQGSTLFSSWIFTPESNTWRFIATWNRPNTNTYLTGLHSFLENFNPNYGYLGRKVLYSNQWVRNAAGVWSERTNATFTVDATGDNQQRMDFKGGVENGKFFLQNGGFFADHVSEGAVFNRAATGQQPTVNLSTLP
jgi:hypothetical protein